MLTLRPQFKVFFRPVKKNGDYIVLGCFVVAQYSDGHCELIKTVYKEVTEAEYRNTYSKQSFNDNSEIIKLSGDIANIPHEILRSTYKKEAVSPYTDFSFFLSQMTRAPSR